ncbi:MULTISPECIES: helix-turn-helix transcriptional regulator [Clostridium]|jgi:transcriptional regulator with XRE-family HTH domain|uniref:Anaerobic benzoate catabolism transcriptional regulator n=2 Tax=Clostridium TaxID=1485 RepID=A0A151APM2_9CLOT|nr:MULTISPECIES: helix-turn-helix transcriptional regulator [Clostridium]KYH29586.1 anaerobic benzoate catabolism transcriptional regulator [Clostridium colicanis DSM 13634]MBE6043890.1 helix-turn-helix domain-containing protein [Clostridium thermopalmarium]PRR72035.1 anaerobic benzoate catabolism transcriptional regulator [Clostridium thermopalmarium DSM 5974]PVZ23687.1 helix-turn-helix protein [Clostridium thermopalmarium DSM 5974]
MSRVGSKIKDARLSLKMTEKQLAKKLGVSEGFIKEVESGRRVINESIMNKISKVLGKDFNDITMSFEAETFEEAIDKKEEKRENKKNVEAVNDIWNDAFSSVLKSVPVYGYDMNKALALRKMPVINNKIEGYSKDKVLFLQIEDDDMIGYRISKGDIAFGHITHEIENNAICLIERGNKRYVRQIKKLDSSKLLLISNSSTLRTETVGIKDIKVLVRLDRVEITL